ncbi:MAG: 2-oxo acid dehydrogenase subunit E2 [Alphaproteobacteria bacterium]|nr:2-oxo acid dehydrogenase subunit E2 [Alphaproteobacteria bacterium]
MPTQILMPALSPTMEEGNLVKWLVKEGDTVRAGDLLAEIETDKATMEFEAVDEGTIGKLLVAEGTEGVKVNAPIAVLLADGEDASAAEAAATPAAPAKTVEASSETPKAAPASSAPVPRANGAVKATPLARRMAEQAGLDLNVLTPTGPGGKVVKADIERAMLGGSNARVGGANAAAAGGEGRLFASPLARRLAKEAGLPLERIEGSGPNGRIIRRDIERVQRDGLPELAEEAAPAAAAPAAQPKLDRPELAGLPDYELVPHTSMRKTIARRLTASKQTVPHFYLTVDVELDNLLEVRKQINANAPEGVKVSVNDFVIKAAAMALMRVPDANAAYVDEGLLKFRSADISVAVAIPNGLITPIIRAAHTKGLADISAEMADLAKRAREGKLQPMEFTGGTFSISNLGMFGVKQFDAVINPPQGAILAVGAGEQRPVVKNGQLAVATVMSCTLSVDHRAIDGALGAQFLAAFKPMIENPALMLL